MISIVPKPTDTAGDNSTAMVINELKRAGRAFRFIDLDTIDPLSGNYSGDLIWVCGLRQDEHQFEVINALSAENTVVNTPESIFTCASKVKTSSLLMKAGIKTPKTLFTASRDIAGEFIHLHKKVVSKPVYGYDGNGIFQTSSMSDLREGPYYLQEYIQNDRDYRVFVIDGEAVGAIMRQSDTLAHNIHQGGTGTPCVISEEMSDIAGRSADAVGVDYGGVDLLDDSGGFTVLEVNGTPNWHCMNAPIPRLLAGYLVKKENEIRC